MPLTLIVDWVRGLFRHPAKLVEFFSGIWTLVWVILAAAEISPARLASIALLSRILPEWLWLYGAGGMAILQLVALAMREWYALRFLAAFFVGCWYAVLTLAAYQVLDLAPALAMYAAFTSMNAYIVLHVLDGRRGT